MYFFHLFQCVTPGKNNLFGKSNARTNELCHENGCIKLSSQLRGEHCMSSSDFFPSECPGLCRKDEDLQCSPRSWLDDFMQPFSWRSWLVRALDFLNKLFLPGVVYIKIVNQDCLLKKKNIYVNVHEAHLVDKFSLSVKGNEISRHLMMHSELERIH